jgi:hypothetical protein
MGTSITILEFLVISGLTIIGYAAVKAAYDTWFK